MVLGSLNRTVVNVQYGNKRRSDFFTTVHRILNNFLLLLRVRLNFIRVVSKIS